MLETLKSRIPHSLKQRIPRSLKNGIQTSALFRFFYVKRQAEVDNIYHCCTHKSASQWVKGLLFDMETYRYSGLTGFQYQKAWMPNGKDSRPYNERRFSRAFPRRRICGPLYFHYECFEALEKPENHRAFFVMRDPRDLAVSYYFSMKHSHGNIGEGLRKRLDALSREEGLCWSIDTLHNMGALEAQRSWVRDGAQNSNVRIFRYEDLVGGDQFQHLRELFDFCTIPMPDEALADLIDRYAFQKLAGGRSKGTGDRKHHYRKGVAGDWRNHFDEQVESHFREVTEDLIEVLGYAW
ncbi:MAG: sulfotransferase domain-containing protein [Balneolaceae bacterium]|nr:sulfotransferase domain-containing protein [Balneolaceae bacterium]